MSSLWEVLNHSRKVPGFLCTRTYYHLFSDVGFSHVLNTLYLMYVRQTLMDDYILILRDQNTLISSLLECRMMIQCPCICQFFMSWKSPNWRSALVYDHSKLMFPGQAVIQKVSQNFWDSPGNWPSVLLSWKHSKLLRKL